MLPLPLTLPRHLSAIDPMVDFIQSMQREGLYQFLAPEESADYQENFGQQRYTPKTTYVRVGSFFGKATEVAINQSWHIF